MVDLRPLLFINLLGILMLLAAGMHYLADEAPTEQMALVTEQTIESRPEQAPSEVIERPVNEPLTETEAADDLMSLLAKPAEPETTVAVTEEPAVENPTTQPEAPVEPIAPMIKPVVEPEIVIEQRIEPTVVTARKAVEAKPVPPTGKLIIHSNVYDDTVLINGKPFGSTRLEVELTPGTYSIEVTKDGYHGWTTRLDVRRGSSQTLKAQLELDNSVQYRDGVWRNSIMNGSGTYTESGVMEYTGAFVSGKFHGTGSARYANGLKYQGDWAQGKMHGRGTLTTSEGDTYVGEMSEDKFNGEGTLTKANGDIYTGYWINGALNGQGTLTTKSGMLYVGGFSENQFHGNGTLTYPDGSYYEGSFSNGLYHGKGSEVYASGKKYVGQFIEGLYHGKGELMNPNGSKISGTFKNGVPFGQATLTTAEGEVFTARSSEPGVCYRLKSYRATECPEMEGW
jgi:hypothetical protein